ncbi:MAG: hypothetical protein ACLSTO_00570 [Bilophila wadsworthia]
MDQQGTPCHDGLSDPWVDAQLAFVTRKNDAITSPEQLKGKTVGARRHRRTALA